MFKFQFVLGSVGDLQKELSNFLLECESKSELCQYSGVFLKIVNVIKQLITADRDGLFMLELSVPLCFFKEFDAINYLIYASHYLENIQVLKTQHLSLYNHFRDGYFVGRDCKIALFSGVAGYMKLDHSMNRFSKGQRVLYLLVSLEMFLLLQDLRFCTTKSFPSSL